ncbi:hypothetical protein Aduo_015550 [Ancylostoma duodenale]
MRDKMQLEFLLIRTELRTLFATPPLLIATGAISDHSWESMISQPQWDESDTPLLMKQQAIENVISDQLQLLEEYRSTLSEIRELLEIEDQKDAHRFQIAVLASLANLTRVVTEGFREPDNKSELVDTIQKTVEECFSRFERNALRDEVSEQPFIKENDRNIRGGEGMPAHAEDREDAPQEEEKDRQNTWIWSKKWKRKMRRKSGGSHKTQLEEQRSSANWISRGKHSRILRISSRSWTGYQDASQDDERTLRCAFCERVGDQYSDSCTVFRNVEERKRLLQSRRRCVACLDVVFTSHICRKRNAPCYHCKARGHNSAICDLPEKSEEIRRQLHNALNGRKDTEEKILALQKELRDLH